GIGGWRVCERRDLGGFVLGGGWGKRISLALGVSGKMALTLLVSGKNVPYIGGISGKNSPYIGGSGRMSLTLVVSRKNVPLTLVVSRKNVPYIWWSSGKNVPYIGDQWEECHLTLVISGKIVPYILDHVGRMSLHCCQWRNCPVTCGQWGMPLICPVGECPLLLASGGMPLYWFASGGDCPPYIWWPGW
ncbi:unnamed protein product, partial [Staurois parvus]